LPLELRKRDISVITARVSTKPKAITKWSVTSKVSEPEFNRKEFLVTEIKDMKLKLREMEALLDTKNKKFERLQEEQLALEAKYFSFINSFNPGDKEI
jgi:hypothetical protein